MLAPIIEFCTSTSSLFWLVLTSDLSIAVAYFAIPITMAVVLRDRKEDIPYPWLWTLFVTFIVACGLTHMVHVWSALSGTEYLWVQAAVGLFCAFTSVATAAAFAFILPQIKSMPSPAQQRAQLERLVSRRTSEKDQLIREINHRVGNQLQIVSSMLSVERRSAESEEAIDILDRLKAELEKMAHEHLERSKVDYLRYGVGAADGTITATAEAGASSKNSVGSKPRTA
jgi:signal transduction histidine kinase